MKKIGIKEAGVRKVRANFFFLRFDTVGARGEKTKFGAEKNFEKMHYFAFFSRAPRMSFDHKNLQAPWAPKPL